MRMADKLEGAVTKDIVQPLMMLYSIGEKDLFFQIPLKEVIAYRSNNNDFKAKNHTDALVLKVKAEGQEKKYCGF
jgi:hypothetical protein